MALPIGDINPTRRRPILNYTVIALNMAAFLVLQPHGGCPEAAFLYEWATVPTELVNLQPLTDGQLQQVIGGCARAVGDKNVLLSVLTAMFLHGSLGHLVGNMLFLWVFGDQIEDRLGRARYLLFYIGGGAIATVAFVLLNPTSARPLLGASGAIAAVLGAYLVLHPRAPVHTYVPFPLYVIGLLPGIRMTSFFFIFAVLTMPAWLVLGGWFLIQIVASANPAADSGVAYVAHAAGFVAGIVLLALLDRRRRSHGEPAWR